MNYLAHAYLSFEDPQILAGNMISDFVKGRSRENFPAIVQKGIQLHRMIDSFTDTHPVNREARKLFHADYGLYSGAFLDIIYDHFLAADPLIFPGRSLTDFSHQTYLKLQDQIGILPENFLKIFPYMRKDNWLLNYQHDWGMRNSFRGLVYRATYLHDADTIFILFEKNYNSLQQYYNRFFPELNAYAQENFNQLLNK